MNETIYDLQKLEVGDSVPWLSRYLQFKIDICPVCGKAGWVVNVPGYPSYTFHAVAIDESDLDKWTPLLSCVWREWKIDNDGNITLVEHNPPHREINTNIPWKDRPAE